MKRSVPYLLAVILGIILTIACDDTLTGSDIDNKTIPSSNVSYQEYIQPLFTVKCAMSGCHNDRSMAAGLVLTSYGFATANYSIISPGNPTTSKLVWAIEGNGARLMPPMGVVNPMTKNQIEGIKPWIREGAKNN